jgi:hypothetical protein
MTTNGVFILEEVSGSCLGQKSPIRATINSSMLELAFRDKIPRYPFVKVA